MNRWIAAAGVLSTATLLLHVIGGGADVHAPILQGNLSTLLKAYASILWHAITVVLVINSAALLVAAVQTGPRRIIVWLVACQYLGFAGLFIFYGIGRLGTLFLMPQWIIFLAISGFALLGLRAGSSSVDAKTDPMPMKLR